MVPLIKAAAIANCVKRIILSWLSLLPENALCLGTGPPIGSAVATLAIYNVGPWPTPPPPRRRTRRLR